jgi:membrane protein YdbS with pleckstrin-like domain
MKATYTDTDKLLFVTSPSQWVNFIWGVIGIGLCWLFLPIVIFIARMIIIGNIQYRFGEKTITEKTGVFSHHMREMHYFRIKSIRIERPFLMRLVGLSNIYMVSSEPFVPEIKLWALTDGEKYSKFIKDRIYFWREKLGVKETDFHNF